MLYQAYQAQRDLTAPIVSLADLSRRWLDGTPPRYRTPLLRQLAATYEMIARSHLTHDRPPYGLTEITVAGATQEVREELVVLSPFASLLRFSTDRLPAQKPRVLLLTALAGHFSTLLRNTVRSLVADHDVYVTDWHNARDVPVADGRFGLGDFIGHVMGFLERIGPGAHVVAVCQPCPAALAATSLMEVAANPAQPLSLTLIAGPIDTRVNPTKVNELAHARPLSWFERTVISTVPHRYRGAGRRVYPGFVQLSAFVSLNLYRHVSQHVGIYNAILQGDDQRAMTIKNFYDEYFAVLDLPAELYLETVDAVFQRDLLPRGELTWQTQPVQPAAITRTALLTIEGEKDDICGVGQTLAAHDLCTSLKPTKKLHHLQAGVGHYGVFSGSRWEQQIYPVLRAFIQANDG